MAREWPGCWCTSFAQPSQSGFWAGWEGWPKGSLQWWRRSRENNVSQVDRLCGAWWWELEWRMDSEKWGRKKKQKPDHEECDGHMEVCGLPLRAVGSHREQGWDPTSHWHSLWLQCEEQWVTFAIKRCSPLQCKQVSREQSQHII